LKDKNLERELPNPHAMMPLHSRMFGIDSLYKLNSKMTYPRVPPSPTWYIFPHPPK